MERVSLEDPPPDLECFAKSFAPSTEVLDEAARPRPRPPESHSPSTACRRPSCRSSGRGGPNRQERCEDDRDFPGCWLRRRRCERLSAPPADGPRPALKPGRLEQ